MKPKCSSIYYYISISIVLIVLLAGSLYLYKLHMTEPFIDGSYDVQEFENLLTPEECDQLIAYSKTKNMTESDVLSYGSSTGTTINKDTRSSKTAWLKDNEHPLVMKIAMLSEKLTGLPRDTQEELQVAYYTPGGKFVDHYDACVEESKDYCDKMNHYAGQRRSTLLIYLNDSFKGGETVFPKINKTIVPKKGKGILFWNTTPDEVIIDDSMHRGNKVEAGEKWICTKWSHVKTYR